MALNIAGVIKNIKQIGIYTPIIEAIVNSIESITQSKREDGRITIKIVRDSQARFGGEDDSIPHIRSFEITDNGVGFTNENLKSFDTLYTEYKLTTGGKGFGRFTFLKFFSDVKIESVFQEKDSFLKRSFKFGTKENIVENDNIEEIQANDTKTTIYLNSLFDEHLEKLDKKIDTVAKRLVDSLLIYFISPDFKCPEIILTEDNSDNSIVLNEFVTSEESIKRVKDDSFEIERTGKKYSFDVKVFKIYSANNQSSNIILCGHNREVTSSPLHNYVPEFKDEFFENVKGESEEEIKKNFIIRTYVIGKYLDENVSLERSRFEIPKKKNDDLLLDSISQEEIELLAVDITKSQFNDDVLSRQLKKRERVEKYVDTETPWNKVYLDKIDFNLIPFDASDVEIETILHKERIAHEVKVKRDISNILKSNDDFVKNIDDVVNQLNEVSKTDLAHYVVLRKSVLDLFKKSLEIQTNEKYDLEKTVHQIVFPLKSNTTNTEYKDHNLWLIDERLSFHEYVSSDEPLGVTNDRPDILIFDKRMLVRNDNELSNPLYVFEFKRPQRDDYAEDDDPIKQINRYVEQIRNGNFKAKNGRTIIANTNTPAYGFIICDLTPKIRSFCRDAQLTPSSDEQAYYGYHTSYKIYFEVVSFDKLVKDSELRNKIFFKKLGLE